MGKGKKRRLYMTTTEWKSIGGGHNNKGKTDKARNKLPFDRCAVSLQPFKNAVCTIDGNVFDHENIIEYMQKYGQINPCTGKPLSIKDLIKLTFHKNTDGEYCCPITYKVFNANTYIVAIRTSGNVYSKDAVDELNIKQKNWQDLCSGEKFKRDDIITIQDPNDMSLRSLDGFEHLKKKKQQHHTTTVAKNNNNDDDEKQNKPRSRQTTKHYTASFTSTSITPQTRNKYALLTATQIREQWHTHIKSLGKDSQAFISMHTNFGDLNFIIRCDLVPRISHNFLELCRNNYYDKCKFHRLIPGFMIQGGDPSATGKGGTTAWHNDGETTIKDEFHDELKHNSAGVLSMANSGANSNKSQFFITFDQCSHLDGKHSAFGTLVGGTNVLKLIEEQPTAKHDRPVNDIIINNISIYRNPFDEKFKAKDELQLDLEKQQQYAKRIAFSKGNITREQYHNDDNDDDDDNVGQWFTSPQAQQQQQQSKSVKVGKYMQVVNNNNPKKKKNAKKKMKLIGKASSSSYSYGNFSNF